MDNIEIVVGTYDSFILGYKLVSKLDGAYGLETSFTEDPREGALRCLYVSPSGVLVSSSSHTSVRLHNLVKRKSLGELYQHDDQVNCVTFYKQSHMFTASDDGTVCMWKTKNWEMMRVLKGHKARVLAVAVHPSGKLALSVGSDRSLLTWDLVTGKLAFQRKLKEAATNIFFTPDGNHYILVYTKRIEICRLEDTSTAVELPSSWRINSVCFMEDNVLAIGGDDRYIRLVDILSGKELLTLDIAKPQEDSFNSRVRCICATVCGKRNLLVAATSNGNIKVFEVDLTERTSNVVLLHTIRVRVTCLAVHNSAKPTKDKGEMSQAREERQVKSDKKHTAEMVVSSPEDDDESGGGDVSEESEDSDTGAVKVAPKQVKQNQKSSKTGNFTSKHSEEVKSVPDRKNKKRKRQQETSQKVNKKSKLQTFKTQTTGLKTTKKMKKASTSPASDVRTLPREHGQKLKKRKLTK